ncbi:MAG: hypothetical protein CMJ83_12840, partial [Planctomycetes bacterium]|nr:hypothetical protein [Planctomycetota bacterium]
MLEIERGGVQTRVLVAILVVVAGAAAAGVWIASGEPEPPTLPDVDLQGSPRPVVAHIEAAQQAVRDDPESAEVWGRLGASLEVHGFILEAVPCYDRAHVLQPRKWKWPYFLGYCHRGVDVAKAVAAFATAVKLKQDHAPLRVVYGDALLQTDQVAEAAGQYQTASEQDPRCAPAWKGLGAVALRRNDLEKAEEYLRRAIGIAPSYREPHQLLSQVHRRRGSEADADHELAQAKLCADEIPLPDSERDALGWYEGQSLEWRSRRSNQYRRAGQLKQAESEWRALLTFEPDSKDAHRELSALLVLQGRIAESKTHYDRARELAPGSIGPLVAYAEAHAQAGKNAEAITLFEEVLTKTPDAISARVNLGAILSRTGQRDRAINELNRIFEKDADNVPALFNLGAVYADALKWSEAAATFERLAKVVPSHPEVWDRWSLAVVRAGHPRQAIEIL